MLTCQFAVIGVAFLENIVLYRKLFIQPQQRQRANDQQLLVFFNGYELTWRLTKLLSLRMLLEKRSDLSSYLQSYYGLPRADNNYIYGPATNGTIFSAIAEVVMYCEDFFALLKFIREAEYFVQKIIQYSAGKVTNVADRIEKSSEADILKAFMVPDVAYLQSIFSASPQPESEKVESLEQYSSGTSKIIQYVRETVATFRQYEFFYNQYKHGLTVALKPFGSFKLPPETILQRQVELTGDLVCYDNDTIEAVFNRTSASPTLMFPDLGPNIMPFISQLMAERNCLRWHPSKANINDLIEAARKVAVLISCLIHNRCDFIQPCNPNCNTFSLPSEKTGYPLSTFHFSIAPISQALTLGEYSVTF